MELGAFWGQINHAQNNTITQLYVSARKHTAYKLAGKPTSQNNTITQLYIPLSLLPQTLTKISVSKKLKLSLSLS